MQAIKHGLKCTLRTPRKALPFLLILTVTAALLTVSFCVFGAVRGYLDDCDDYFHTIAELEYIGVDYPDRLVYDEDLVRAVEENREALEGLIASDPVLSFEPASSEFASSPLISRWDDQVPDPNAAVLRLHFVAYDDRLGLINAIVTETCYSRRDYTGKLIMLQPAEDVDVLRADKDIVTAGRWFSGTLPNPCLQQASVTFHENGHEITLPLHRKAAEPLEEDDPFLIYAAALHRKNDACRVTCTAAIEDLYPFHQQILKLTKGRYFTQEEYASRAHVCVLSERITGMLGLDVGDRIPLEVFRASGDLYDSESLTQADAGDYEIVGIQSNDESWPYWIFLPDSEAAHRGITPVNGYTLGQFRLKNSQVPAFLEAAGPLLERGFRLNVYDQGYAAATEPMEELLFISTLFLAVCLLLAVCALALQSHIFISRQRDAALTMHALGSGRTHVCVYFLSAALALTILAAVLGACIGRQVEGRVFTLLKDFAAQFADQDLRFSSSRLAILRTLDFDPSSSPRSYLAAALALVGGSLLFTLIFAWGSLREREKAVKKQKTVRKKVHKRAAKVSRLSGFFKYGLLSVRRGAVRTVSVLGMGLIAALFFGQLTSSLEGYRTQLEVYRENAEITGTAADFYGKRVSGLVLRSHPIARLQAGGLIENACVTNDLGHIQILGPVDGEQVPFEWPDYGSFAYETAFDRIYKGPVLTGTSSISHSPLFHFTKGGSVEWAEGWSEADFVRTELAPTQEYDPFLQDYVESWYETGPSVCAVPQSMMEELGIRLGDEVDAVFAFYYQEYTVLMPGTLRVVAAYTASTSSTAVFTPLNYVLPGMAWQAIEDAVGIGDYDSWIRGELWTREELAAAKELGAAPRGSYSSFSFSLTDTDRLDELRQGLQDAGFTWVRSNDRKANCAVIEDEVFLNTTHSMERQIQYVGVLYNALYLLAGVIGFTLAWLLVQSRRKEIAVMRALGTPPGRIVGNFLAEQTILILAGLGLGVGVSRLLGASLSRTQLILTAAFFGLWFLASLLCLILGLWKKSYAALTEPE